MIKILIADDHQIFRQGLKALLDHVDDFETIGEVANGQEAIDFVAAHKVDVVIMDINMPGINGIDATEHITKISQAPGFLHFL